MARFRRRLGRRHRLKLGRRMTGRVTPGYSRARRNLYRRSLISGPPAPHYFKRWTASPGGVSTLANTALTADNMAVFAFKLSDLPNYQEFTALYDQYMITKVVLKFVHVRDQALITNTAPAGGTSGGRVFTIIDHDDASVPATANEFRQYATCKVSNVGRDITRVTVPAVLRQMWENSIATSYTPAFHQWISTTDPDTEHFGIKACLHVNDAATVTNAIQYSVEAMYYIKCKSVK